jgi:phosphoglycerate dehydrogenase-like enzyme
MRIVFPDGAGCVTSPADLEPLHKLGDVEFHDGPPATKAELIERCRNAEAIVLDYSLLDADVLRAAPRLKFISFLGIGYKSCIDAAEATRLGIVIANTPDYGATSVAEHALAMMLALTRHVGAAHVSMREGRWEPARFRGMELRGKTLGIVGLGAGIGMQLIGWTRRATPDRARHGLTLVSLVDVFSGSDVVSLHLSYTDETAGLVSRELLSRMRPGSWFVNTARSALVDNRALFAMLESGALAGAALDVYDEEPVPADDPVRRLPNVLLTPHIGYNTPEAGRNMLRISIETLDAFTRGERLHVVN